MQTTSAGWVAGGVRARLLAKRRIGAGQARRVAACDCLASAIAMLDSTAYRIAPGTLPGAAADPLDGLAAAQQAIGAALLWDLRVLAGWLPRGGAALMRALAGWFEIANVAELLRELDGLPRRGGYFRLGGLSTAWPRARQARTLAEVRAALSASAWQDPGGATSADIEVGLRARWAQRVAALGEPARTWAVAGLALLLAGERFGAGRAESPALRSVTRTLLGRAAAGARSVDELAAALPHPARWVLAAGTAVTDLWLNEAAWWAHVEKDASGLLARPGRGATAAMAAAALLAADARRVWSALEVAARGGGAIEVFDALA